jgi:hypothetical protein
MRLINGDIGAVSLCDRSGLLPQAGAGSKEDANSSREVGKDVVLLREPFPSTSLASYIKMTNSPVILMA